MLVKFFQIKGKINSSSYSVGVASIGTISLISGNPAGFLSMAKVMQYLTLFQFISFKIYP